MITVFSVVQKSCIGLNSWFSFLFPSYIFYSAAFIFLQLISSYTFNILLDFWFLGCTSPFWLLGSPFSGTMGLFFGFFGGHS